MNVAVIKPCINAVSRSMSGVEEPLDNWLANALATANVDAGVCEADPITDVSACWIIMSASLGVELLDAMLVNSSSRV